MPKNLQTASNVIVKKNLLLVDDNKEFLNSFKEYLEQRGYSVRCCTNLELAKDLIQTEKFDAVFSDLNMLDGHGLLFLNYVRTHVQWPIPFIFVTALTSIAKKLRVQPHKIDAILTKPFLEKDLQSILQKFLS